MFHDPVVVVPGVLALGFAKSFIGRHSMGVVIPVVTVLLQLAVVLLVALNSDAFANQARSQVAVFAQLACEVVG